VAREWGAAVVSANTAILRPHFRILQHSVHFFLAGIKFHNGLLVTNGLDFVARRDAQQDPFERLFVQRQPIGHRPAGGDFQIPAGQLAGGVGCFDLDYVVHLQPIGRNIDLAGIDSDVAMADQLPGGGAGIGKTQMITDIVQPGFQNLQHLLAGNATAFQGAFVNAAELAFEQAIIVAQFLFLDQPQGIVGLFAA